MAEAEQPTEGAGVHPFVSPEMVQFGIQEEERLNLTYLESANIFKAEVIDKLAGCSAMKDGGGWAVFMEFEGGSDEAPNTLYQPRKTFVKIYPAAVKVEPDITIVQPCVRIVTNEITRGEAGMSLFSEDVAIDEKGNALYFFDGVPIIVNGMVERPDYGRSWVRCIMLEDGEPNIYGNRSPGTNMPFTPMQGIPYKYKDVSGRIIPFGLHTNQTDRLYALNRAQEIFDRVKHLPPYHCLGETAE